MCVRLCKKGRQKAISKGRAKIINQNKKGKTQSNNNIQKQTKARANEFIVFPFSMCCFLRIILGNKQTSQQFLTALCPILRFVLCIYRINCSPWYTHVYLSGHYIRIRVLWPFPRGPLRYIIFCFN